MIPVDIEDTRRAFEIEARSMGIEAVWLERSRHHADGYAFREVDRLWRTWTAALVYANSLRQENSR